MSRPVLQEIRGNMTCGKCKRDLWDCQCPPTAECTECELSVEDVVEGVMCEYAPDGVHLWKVPDGDGFKIVRDLDDDEEDSIIEAYDWGSPGSTFGTVLPEHKKILERYVERHSR